MIQPESNTGSVGKHYTQWPSWKDMPPSRHPSEASKEAAKNACCRRPRVGWYWFPRAPHRHFYVGQTRLHSLFFLMRKLRPTHMNWAAQGHLIYSCCNVISWRLGLLHVRSESSAGNSQRYQEMQLWAEIRSTQGCQEPSKIPFSQLTRGLPLHTNTNWTSTVQRNTLLKWWLSFPLGVDLLGGKNNCSYVCLTHKDLYTVRLACALPTCLPLPSPESQHLTATLSRTQLFSYLCKWLMPFSMRLRKQNSH